MSKQTDETQLVSELSKTLVIKLILIGMFWGLAFDFLFNFFIGIIWVIYGVYFTELIPFYS